MEEMTIFKPNWMFNFIYAPNHPGKILFAYSDEQVLQTAEQIGVDDFLTGQLGQFGNIWVYNTDAQISDEHDIDISNAVKVRIGIDPLPFHKVEESLKNGDIPTFLMPQHGCFGYIAGHMIIGQRHHQEIMFRLLEIGWTWDDLMNAPQVWGWFSGNGTNWNVWFSSDAGLMTGEDLKTEVQLKLSKMVGAQVKITGGYGGKSKTTFGGNFKEKYGDPKKQTTGEMEGYKAKYKNSVLSPLPPPPVQEEKKETPLSKINDAATHALNALLPGGGKSPPKKKYSAIEVWPDENVPQNTAYLLQNAKTQA